MAAKRVSVERLKEALSYDPDTGILRWLVRCGKKGKVGAVAGSNHNCGYIVIGLDKTAILAHRATWALTHREWPVDEIDHRDGNRSNNRLKNLREATHEQNMENLAKPKNNTSGYVGVYYMKKKKLWRAMVWSKGEAIRLGTYKRIEDAIEARLEGQARYYSFQPVPRHMDSAS